MSPPRFVYDPDWPEEWYDSRNYLHWHTQKSYKTRSLEDITGIVLHHVGTEPWPCTGLELCQATARFCVQERDWPGNPYHFIIPLSGQIYLTNGPEVISYHVAQFNRTTIGICLEGKFMKGSEPNYRQLKSTAILLQQLRDIGVDWKAFMGHREFRPTDCPGDTFIGPVGWKGRFFSGDLDEALYEIKRLKVTLRNIRNLADSRLEEAKSGD